MSEKPKKSVDGAMGFLLGVSIYKFENSRFWCVRVQRQFEKRFRAFIVNR